LGSVAILCRRKNQQVEPAGPSQAVLKQDIQEMVGIAPNEEEQMDMQHIICKRHLPAENGTIFIQFGNQDPDKPM